MAVEQEREGEREKENERLKERDGKWERELARTVKAKDEEQGKMMAGLKLSRAFCAPSFGEHSLTQGRPPSRPIDQGSRHRQARAPRRD